MDIENIVKLIRKGNFERINKVPRPFIHTHIDRFFKEASVCGNAELLLFFLEQGADINFDNGYALRKSIENNYFEAFNLLLYYGADHKKCIVLNEKLQPVDALSYTIRHGRAAYAEALLKIGHPVLDYHVDILEKNIYHKKLEIIKLFIDQRSILDEAILIRIVMATLVNAIIAERVLAMFRKLELFILLRSFNLRKKIVSFLTSKNRYPSVLVELLEVYNVHKEEKGFSESPLDPLKIVEYISLMNDDDIMTVMKNNHLAMIMISSLYNHSFTNKVKIFSILPKLGIDDFSMNVNQMQTFYYSELNKKIDD